MKTKAMLLLSLLCTMLHAQVIEIDNLGPSINSDYPELNPIISADGRTLYFIRANHPGNRFGDSATQDIWISEMGDDGQWRPAVHAGPQLNRSRFNTLYHVSVDGSKMLIGGSYFDGINWGVGFSSIEKHGDTWTDPVFLTIRKFEDMCRGEYSSASMLPDNRTLVLSFSEADGGIVNDLYVSFKQLNGKWSAPVSLGADINTGHDETTPFMAPDGVTLYFASDRPGGLGKKDIYVSRRLDASWKKWSAPVNMGPPINTERPEGYYTIPASGREGYMVSHRNKAGKSDIIRIKMVEHSKPNPVLLLSGRVINGSTGKPMDADITYEV
jgi:Tol biopolymer transport system component